MGPMLRSHAIAYAGRIGSLFAIAAVATLAFAGQGWAATFGADLSLPVDNNCTNCALVALTHTGGAAENGSPFSGVLVSASVRTSGSALTGKFRVLHPTGNPYEFTNVGEAPVMTLMDADPAGHVTQVGTRIPISAGDRLAVTFPGVVAYDMHSDVGASCAAAFEPPDHPVGTTTTYSYHPAVGCIGADVLVSGIVEPDADHDGFGDQSQDLCPTDASTHGACPVAPAKKKCRRRHHSAAKAKKRCKRRKHHKHG
jgi:hypothetical protein